MTPEEAVDWQRKLSELPDDISEAVFDVLGAERDLVQAQAALKLRRDELRDLWAAWERDADLALREARTAFVSLLAADTRKSATEEARFDEAAHSAVVRMSETKTAVLATLEARPQYVPPKKNMPMKKVCAVCKQEKHKNTFRRSPASPDGLNPICVSCVERGGPPAVAPGQSRLRCISCEDVVEPKDAITHQKEKHALVMNGSAALKKYTVVPISVPTPDDAASA